MNRKNFLRNAMMTIAVSLVPKILRPVDYSDCVFDADRINERLDHLRKYPLEAKDCYPPEWVKDYHFIETGGFTTKYFTYNNGILTEVS